MRQLRHAQIRAYFFGNGSGNASGGGVNGTLLNPHTQMLDYQVLKIFKVASSECKIFVLVLLMEKMCVFVYIHLTWENPVLERRKNHALCHLSTLQSLEFLHVYI